MSRFKRIIMITLLSVVILSCSSSKNIAYFQNTIANSEVQKFEPVLQSDDVLNIVISSENPEIAAPYNLKTVVFQGNTENSVAQERLQTYLIDQEGFIELPMIGKVKLAGLSRTAAVNEIKKVLTEHIKDPIVNLRIVNFKVSILGEVVKPGMYTIQSERVTLVEALALAGDLTIYGKRTDILLIREKEGVKTMQRIDITKSDFINSPYYYLTQNDVVYIEPNKTRVNSSVIGPNIAVGISALSLVVTILALTIK